MTPAGWIVAGVLAAVGAGCLYALWHERKAEERAARRLHDDVVDRMRPRR